MKCLFLMFLLLTYYMRIRILFVGRPIACEIRVSVLLVDLLHEK